MISAHDFLDPRSMDCTEVHFLTLFNNSFFGGKSQNGSNDFAKYLELEDKNILILIHDDQGAAFFKNLVMIGHESIKDHDVFFRRFDCCLFPELY